MASMTLPSHGAPRTAYREAALKDGITLGDDVVESLRAAATEASLALPSSLA